jgi:hypothetical protein
VTVGIRFLIADLEEISLEEAELSRWPRRDANSDGSLRENQLVRNELSQWCRDDDSRRSDMISPRVRHVSDENAGN